MKVTEILDPEFRSGTGKKGRWVLVKIQAGDKVATGFGPVMVGDEVDLTYNPEYKNYGFRVLHPQEIPDVDVNDDMKSPTQLDRIEKKLDELLERVKPLDPELDLDAIPGFADDE